MAQRARYLVAYDIRDSTRLRRVHKVAKDYGYPLQYSVFICDLTAAELIALKSALTTEANLSHDSIVVLDLGPPDTRGTECIEFLGVRRNLERPGEAAIW